MEITLSRFHNRNFELLEPYEGKLSCTVLRGEGSRKGADLPGYKAQGFSYGTDNADPDKLNSQRVWVDEGNPQFGEGPNLN